MTCSFDGGEPENCSPTLVVSVDRFGTDPHSVVMTATDRYGQIYRIGLGFQLSGKSTVN